MKVKIRLDTLSDVAAFVTACEEIETDVKLTDDKHFCVSAKSLLGAMYTMEWSEVYCTCEKDIYNKIERFVVIE